MRHDRKHAVEFVVLLALFVGIIVVGGVGIAKASMWAPTKVVGHTCHTPCTVTLPKDTLEDEWSIDYGWKSKHAPILSVYFTGHNRPGVHYDDVAISQDARGNVTLVQGLRNGRPVVTLFDRDLVD
jgi:hypothetical protein